MYPLGLSGAKPAAWCTELTYSHESVHISAGAYVTAVARRTSAARTSTATRARCARTAGNGTPRTVDCAPARRT